MHVLRLNLHFDLPHEMSIPDALRQLSDFVEQPQRLEPPPYPISQNNTHGAFYSNRQKGCRLTGSMAVCSLYTTGWVSRQDGLNDLVARFDDSDFIVVK